MTMKRMKTRMNDLMVTKWSVKNPLTIDERRKIQEGLELNMSYAQIALHVGRSKSAVLRESKRLGDTKNYDPEKAQSHFEGIQIARRNKQKVSQKISQKVSQNKSVKNEN